MIELNDRADDRADDPASGRDDEPVNERETAAGEASPRRPAWTTRALDRGTDLALLAFAAWTVIYHLGLLLRPPTWILLDFWFAAMVVILALYVWRRVTGARSAPLWTDRPSLWRARAPWPFALIAVAAGLGAAWSGSQHKYGTPWVYTWSLGLVSVGATVICVCWGGIAARRTGEGEREPAESDRGPAVTEGDRWGEGYWGSLVGLLTSAGFAAASLFIVNTDADDAFFVSRSVATAAEGRIPFHDVIFSSGDFGPVAGEPPVSSVEVLSGAMARFTGLAAPSFLWFVTLPVITFIAVWSMWRLVRAWAPRRVILCFVTAAVFLLWTGGSGASIGAFHLLRMWQGKAMLVSALIPLLYVYFTRLAERRTATSLLMVFAAGIVATGMTSTAAFVLPLVTAAAVAPLVLTGRIRTGAAACLAMAYPLGAGVLVKVFHDNTEVIGKTRDAPSSFGMVLLAGVPALAAGCGLWLAPWLARRGVPALFVTGIAVLLSVLFVGDVLKSIGETMHTGQVMWRAIWIAPVPVLVGLLAAVPLPLKWMRPVWVRASFGIVPAAALCTTMIIGGIPLWSSRSGSSVESAPSWKADPDELKTSQEVVRMAEARGGRFVLMPFLYMRTVPQFSARVHAVNPNDHYLEMLPAPRQYIDDRLLLTRLARGAPKPTKPESRDTLQRVGVTVACVFPADAAGLRRLKYAGYTGNTNVGLLVCAFPGGLHGRPITP
ncbi:hypothetical protein J4573_39890 [Actinomadura barringtoniae]|uniref:Uncharacterized protein n=1 Tax=Actinomadura barringtoniae TaxID=1427535 RepID=A0A939PJI2_9ACTN|nr:DUF6077 domain-containing protein [Actinomadura barringtoniae]MBO2453313.1 hypothetical protein [Actinomadura barringtoniae]